MDGKITNGDIIRAMSNEQLAEFLADEQYRVAIHVFNAFGFGIEKQVIYARRLMWLNSEAELDPQE